MRIIIDFSFNSFSNPIVKEFGSDLSMHTYARPGLSFHSKCRRAYNDVIYISKGYGHFDVMEEASSLDCPICQTSSEVAINCGYCDAKVTFTGRTTEGYKRVFSGIASDWKYHTFQEADETHWISLKVEVERLE